MKEAVYAAKKEQIVYLNLVNVRKKNNRLFFKTSRNW